VGTSGSSSSAKRECPEGGEEFKKVEGLPSSKGGKGKKREILPGVVLPEKKERVRSVFVPAPTMRRGRTPSLCFQKERFQLLSSREKGKHQTVNIPQR